MILSNAKRRVFVTTLVPTVIGTSTSPLVRGTGLFLFAALRLQELDIHIGSVDANKFATAIGQTRGRREQKEFLEIETLDGTLHGQLRVVVRYGWSRQSRRHVPSMAMMKTSYPRPNVTRSSTFFSSAIVAASYREQGSGRKGTTGIYAENRTPSLLQSLVA